MGKIRNKIRELRNEKYTLMIIPNKTGSTKYIVVSKLIVPIFVLIILITLGTLSLLSIGFLMESHNNSILAKQSSESASMQVEINQYKKDSAKVTAKLEELLTLESTVKSLIGDKSSNTPISRGGTGDKASALNVTTVDDGIKNLNALLDDLSKYVNAQKSIPTILPCQGNITSPFGNRVNPFNKYASDFHPGIDIANSYGTIIRASANGTVTHASWSAGYGNEVIINHGNGYETIYGHNSKISVQVGATVKAGDIIAYMGSTGESTGTHCHFEIRLNGTPINPMDLVKGGY